MATPETREVWIQTIRAPDGKANQHFLWELAQTLIHEYLHTLEHPDYGRYAASLGKGSLAHNTLIEGVVSLLTEIVWRDVEPGAGQTPLRQVIEGEYAQLQRLDPLPSPRHHRYSTFAETMKLIHVVGSVHNLYAAFFLGDVASITGPISVAVMGSPAAPLPAGEVAALVRRLNAMPDAHRRRLRISLYADAARQKIERLLTEAGADVLAVWSDAGRSLGEPPQQHVSAVDVRERGLAPPQVMVEATPSGFYLPDGRSLTVPRSRTNWQRRRGSLR
jgi:hypothetical protein